MITIVRASYLNQSSLCRGELKKFGSHMAEEDDIRDKLLDANRLISKLKGEILKLSTEVQQGQQGNDDELVEENMELKQQVPV